MISKETNIRAANGTKGERNENRSETHAGSISRSFLSFGGVTIAF